jgi:hypothetical protein
MKLTYKIVTGSAVGYNETVAYIVIDDKPIALLSDEERNGNIKIEFMEDPWVTGVSLDVFLQALQEAKRAINGGLDEFFSIETGVVFDQIIIKADGGGLRLLANHLLTLSDTEDGTHIHLDEHNSLEDGSLGLVIQKGLI